MTLQQLQAMGDREIDALAATEIKKWTSKQMGAWLFWFDGDKRTGYTVSQGIGSRLTGDWEPTCDRNQSGDLLDAMVKRGVHFGIDFDGLPLVYAHSGRIPSFEVKGNDPRAETIAALLAHFALEDKAGA